MEAGDILTRDMFKCFCLWCFQEGVKFLLGSLDTFFLWHPISILRSLWLVEERKEVIWILERKILLEKKTDFFMESIFTRREKNM